jgi:translation initiation factor 1
MTTRTMTLMMLCPVFLVTTDLFWMTLTTTTAGVHAFSSRTMIPRRASCTAAQLRPGHVHCFPPPGSLIPRSTLGSTSSDDDDDSSSSSSKISSRIVASISSDGTIDSGVGKSNNQAPRSTGSLGKPKKRKANGGGQDGGSNNNNSNNQKTIMSKKDRQRTANGTIVSNSTARATTGSRSVPPDQQDGVQVVRGNRGSKTVTIVRGMDGTSEDEKKTLLKLLKSKLGVGGTLVDGVLEIQGTHTDKVVDILKGVGYTKTRKVGT